MTGIVDIAMVGSLCKKGEFHNLLNDYGLVIIDECNHSASETIANVLKEKQLSGVQITIVTWAPDSYGFGDASYWLSLIHI